MVQLRKMPQLPSVSILPGKPLETGLPSSDFIRASSLGVRDGPDGGPPPVFLSDLLIPSIFSFAKKNKCHYKVFQNSIIFYIPVIRLKFKNIF